MPGSGSYATAIPYIKRANYINSRKKILAYFYMLSRQQAPYGDTI